MSFDPASIALIFVGSTPIFYLTWASLNCFCRKPQETSDTRDQEEMQIDELRAPLRGSFSRQISSDVECSSPGSARSCIDSQLVSWERLGYVLEVGDQKTPSRAYE